MALQAAPPSPALLCRGNARSREVKSPGRVPLQSQDSRQQLQSQLLPLHTELHPQNVPARASHGVVLGTQVERSPGLTMSDGKTLNFGNLEISEQLNHSYLVVLSMSFINLFKYW